MPPKNTRTCVPSPPPQDSPLEQPSKRASKQPPQQPLQQPQEQPSEEPQEAPGDPDTSEKTPDAPDEPDHPYDEESTPSLATAIMLMTQELCHRENSSSSHSIGKVKEPNTFDGSEPWKLNNFILLCNLYFRNNPSYYDDEPKVIFALSFLCGTALEYFEPAILDSNETPPWMDNWSAFIRTLRTQFGPIDPTADAEDGIDNLKMQDNQRIVKYNVEFNRLVIRTSWDNSVLCHRYYSGLVEQIKDIMGQQGKPATLEAMKALAHSIDSHHYEHLREKSCSEKNKPDKDKSDKDKSDKNLATRTLATTLAILTN